MYCTTLSFCSSVSRYIDSRSNAPLGDRPPIAAFRSSGRLLSSRPFGKPSSFRRSVFRERRGASDLASLGMSTTHPPGRVLCKGDGDDEVELNYGGDGRSPCWPVRAL